VSFGLPDFLGKPLGVVLIDLLLAGDNAVVIALVCLALPARSVRWVLLFGTLGAIGARLVLTVCAGWTLEVPGLKLAGGALLALLALNLARRDHTPLPTVSAQSADVVVAALVLMIVDVLMSLDNVLALAAVAGDSPFYLALGLTLSVAILMFASAFVARVLRANPDLARLGAALLGWVAASMLVSDRLLAAWVNEQSPALPAVLPLLAAAYVYLLGGGPPQRVTEPLVPVVMRQKRTAPRIPVPPPPMTPPDEDAIPGENATSTGGEMWLFLGLFALSAVFITIVVVLAGGVTQ
jgi:YjbE family integral membrane protein